MAAAAGGSGGGAGGGGGGEAVAAPGAGYQAIISVDVGNTGTGYAILYPDPSKLGDLAVLIREVQTYSTDYAMVTSNKAPTAVLLDPSDGNKLVEVGGAALKRFHELAAQESPPPAVLYTEFMKLLAPGASADPAAIMVSGVSTRKGPGAPPPDAVPALLLVQRVLEAVTQAVQKRMNAQMSETVALVTRKLWVLTVPATWDARGKELMRQAAAAAGLVPSADAPNLLVAEKPECALLAAIAGVAPPVRESLAGGKRVMIVNCGGSTVDIAFDEVMSLHPLAVRELAPPQSGPWGASLVDAQLRRFLVLLLGADVMARVDARTMMNMMDKWEADKTSVGAHGPDADAGVSLRMFDIMGATDLDNDGMMAKVQEFNSRAGYPAVTYTTPRHVLKIDGRVVRSFFGAVTKDITAFLCKSLAEVRRVDTLLLVGGFGSSPYLLHEVENIIRPLVVVRPEKSGMAVVAGATLYALQLPTFHTRF